jgi:DUF4097 and DUF4098 domain-containing protein YvlB
MRLIVLAAALVPLLGAQHHESDWTFENQETINRTFKVASGDNVSKLLVDTVNGYIHVTGGPGSEIKVKVEKHIRAETQSDLDRARHDVTLDMSQDGNTVKLYENGPFRTATGMNWSSDRYRYYVKFDCEIEVPAGAQLDLHELNGPIQIKKSSGNFNIKTLNGKVDMQEIGGVGSVKTLNGAVSVAFARNPEAQSSFDTLNGAIDVYFQPALSADISFKTLHGGVYSDFDVTTVPTVIRGDGSGTRFIYRSGGNMKVRAGKGGAALSFRTLNGAIRLHSKPA